MSSRSTARLTAAFYGDDFTGSTDALTQFHRFGLRSVLLFEPPDAGLLARLARDYDVVGVAGVGRSLPPALMEAEIGPILRALRDAGPRLVQYKMCSTADSAPELGSLGRAVEIGRDIFGATPVPILAAQPEFGRYTAFGTHFAAERGVVHRLDRQPTMSTHPSTPMTEADLRRHLGRQTMLPVASFDLTGYELPWESGRRRYEEVLAGDPGGVVFDAVTSEHTVTAAGLMLDGHGGGPLYALGSGGLSYGLAASLAGGSRDRPPLLERPLAAASPVLAVSGSCATRTAEQIGWALARGWEGIRLDVAPGRGVDTSSAALARLRSRVLAALGRGRDVVVYTSRGESASPQPAAGRADGRDGPLSSIGRTLGYVVREALREAGLRRVVVAGGDTSGRVVRALGATSAEIDTVLGIGTALCRVDAPDPAVGGAQILLKGGQTGGVDLFERVRYGAPTTMTTTISCGK